MPKQVFRRNVLNSIPPHLRRIWHDPRHRLPGCGVPTEGANPQLTGQICWMRQEQAQNLAACISGNARDGY